jgi:hypothetical protein
MLIINKLLLILFIFLIFNSCSAGQHFEGSITYLGRGVLEDKNSKFNLQVNEDTKYLEWADEKDIDILLKEGRMKQVSLIKVRNKNNQVESFHVDPNLNLEKINFLFTYSHLQSHMISSNKIKIDYLTSKSTNSPRNRETIKIIIGLKFIDHEH